MHLNKRMFQSILWLQKLTYAASVDNNRHNPPSDGANVDEYVFKARFLMKPLITLFFCSCATFPLLNSLVFNLCSASSVRYILHHDVVVCVKGTHRIPKLIVQGNCERCWWCFDYNWAGQPNSGIRFAAVNTSTQQSWLHRSMDWVWPSCVFSRLQWYSSNHHWTINKMWWSIEIYKCPRIYSSTFYYSN